MILMVKIEFDIIKPNLHIIRYKGNYDNEVIKVIYGLHKSDHVVNTAKAINEIVKKHIDDAGLKVTESDLETREKGRCERIKTEYNVSLDKYLENERLNKEIITDNSRLFNVGYLLDASTLENPDNMDGWSRLKRDIAKGDKLFDELEEDQPFRYNRKETLKNMKKLYERMDSKIPDQHASLYILQGLISSGSETRIGYIGGAVLLELREKGKAKIEEAKSELIERLKEFKGPCLSSDARIIMRQTCKLCEDSPSLIAKYGDILLNPNWRQRFFMLDP